VQLLPEGEAPGDWQRIEGEQLDAAGVASILRGIPTAAGDDAGDFRISLAGAQEKTALLRHAGAWHRPLGTTPTTHIFKLPLGHVGNMRLDLATSVENEWLCAQIARAYGLAVADCEMASFEEQKVLVVERFDRRLSADGKYWLRLPQEDMCQALGVPPSLKYEADGGPGIRAILDLLLGSTRADADRLAFFKTQVMFWLLCATDGHAKNFSLTIQPRSRYRLTPLYDLLSAWPVLGHGANRLAPEKARMAMALLSGNRHYKWQDILPRHWLSAARICGIDQDAARTIIGDLVDATPKVVAAANAALPGGFPASVSSPILCGLETSARRLAALA
jgi:serine/threonine-protein kinase HipA